MIVVTKIVDAIFDIKYLAHFDDVGGMQTLVQNGRCHASEIAIFIRVEHIISRGGFCRLSRRVDYTNSLLVQTAEARFRNVSDLKPLSRHIASEQIRDWSTVAPLWSCLH